MIETLLTAQPMIPTYSGPSRSSPSLSNEDQETISSILENYDPNNLSPNDASNIIQGFQEAGIAPSREFGTQLEALGFDPQELINLVGSKRDHNNMPPPPSKEEEESVSELLDILLNPKDKKEKTSSAAFENLLDYTSRILNLKESSKTEVMDMLDKYSSPDNPYTKEQTNSLIKNALEQTLNDSSNYKSVSFYA
ncbi:hypothetical protein [Poseidonibacter sp.]|uniref:hypothetical protein n=1 Tax=Poseidonibacter sp. TaxID=2321188 RepID=UPI003C774320